LRKLYILCARLKWRKLSESFNAAACLETVKNIIFYNMDGEYELNPVLICIKKMSKKTYQESESWKWLSSNKLCLWLRHCSIYHTYQWLPLISPQRITNKHNTFPSHSYQKLNSIEPNNNKLQNHSKNTIKHNIKNTIFMSLVTLEAHS
jgi:hypothetical protein